MWWWGVGVFFSIPVVWWAIRRATDRMRGPVVYTLRGLCDMASHLGVQCEVRKGVWMPARPLGLSGLYNRLWAAFIVLKGDADVVVWPEDHKKVFH